MQLNENWQVASLTPQELQKLQQIEPQIKSSTGQNVVLIAYQRK